VMTGQSIHLLAMMTEAIHTPFLSDRHLAIKNAKMVQSAMRHLQDEIRFAEDGRIVRRAQDVLRQAERLLDDIARTGLFEALERGVFADVRRSRSQGKGLDGVIKKHPEYRNPAMEMLREALK